jgi:FkbM family methyltransferase
MQLRDLLIKAVSIARPKLFYYKANKASREGIKVAQSARYIDVIRAADRSILRISRSNYIYLIDMIQSFDYFFYSSEPSIMQFEGKAHQIVDFSTPRLQRVIGFPDFPIMCPSLTEAFSSIQQYLDFAELQPGQTVLDLGAYSALTSIAFSKSVTNTGRVVALEPDPKNFTACEENVASNYRVNGLDNISLVAAAISDKPGVLQLSSEGSMGSSLSSIVGKHRGTMVDVQCVTFDELVATNDLDRVDFIKMDIEGAELATILGSAEFLMKYRPRMIIEPHYIDRQITSKPIIRFLTEIGYDCQVIDQPGFSLPLITALPVKASH